MNFLCKTVQRSSCSSVLAQVCCTGSVVYSSESLSVIADQAASLAWNVPDLVNTERAQILDILLSVEVFGEDLDARVETEPTYRSVFDMM